MLVEARQPEVRGDGANGTAGEQICAAVLGRGGNRQTGRRRDRCGGLGEGIPSHLGDIGWHHHEAIIVAGMDVLNRSANGGIDTAVGCIRHNGRAMAACEGRSLGVRRHNERTCKDVPAGHQGIEHVLKHPPRQLGALAGVEHGGETGLCGRNRLTGTITQMRLSAVIGGLRQS